MASQSTHRESESALCRARTAPCGGSPSRLARALLQSLHPVLVLLLETGPSPGQLPPLPGALYSDATIYGFV